MLKQFLILALTPHVKSKVSLNSQYYVKYFLWYDNSTHRIKNCLTLYDHDDSKKTHDDYSSLKWTNFTRTIFEMLSNQ